MSAIDTSRWLKYATIMKMHPIACKRNVDDIRLKGLARLTAGWRADSSPAVFAARYFLAGQMARHRDAFASRKRKDVRRPHAPTWLAALDAANPAEREALLLDYVEHYQFRGVRAHVPTALGQWLRGRWPLELRHDIPSARAILRAQARGTRPVTAITAYPRMLAPVLTKPDAFAFFLHDLEHAYKFFYSPALYAGQRAFFVALETAIDRGMFACYVRDPVFADKFTYLMSDMNTHPQHSRQYLRAILIEFYLRADGRPPAAPLSAAAERAVDSIVRIMADTSPLAVCA